jgi:hypothetical protein
VAGDAVMSEPVSSQIPCKQGNIQGIFEFRPLKLALMRENRLCRSHFLPEFLTVHIREKNRENRVPAMPSREKRHLASLWAATYEPPMRLERKGLGKPQGSYSGYKREYPRPYPETPIAGIKLCGRPCQMSKQIYASLRSEEYRDARARLGWSLFAKSVL